MKRETCMFKARPGMTGEIESGVRAYTDALQKRLAAVGAQNASVWAVDAYLYVYAEFEDGASLSLKDVLAPWMGELLTAADLVAAPGEMRLMYHDIGIVRADKRLVRRRVFATRLKDGCAGEYKARHQKLIDARGDAVSKGPESNFTIWCAKDRYIFGYCELVRAYDHEPTPEERESTAQWETRQLEIMDWLTNDVDWLTKQTHPAMKCLLLQKGFEG